MEIETQIVDYKRNTRREIKCENREGVETHICVRSLFAAGASAPFNDETKVCVSTPADFRILFRDKYSSADLRMNVSRKHRQTIPFNDET